MAAALVSVKRQLGSQAVILHTRTYKRGGILGLGAKTVVEITASDDAPVGRRRRKEPLGTQYQSSATASPLAGDLIRRTYAAAQSELARNNVPCRCHRFASL